jgi:formamidopyrimidine-DNA glycosylase
VIVGGDVPIAALAYGASTSGTRFDRWALQVQLDGSDDAVLVRLSDPRRLARVLLSPDLSDLGPDATEVDATVLGERLRGRRSPIKAVLLDQAVVAGLGNLLADELLWRCGVAPDRAASSLTGDEVANLAATLPVMLTELSARGGSHRGDLAADLRRAGAVCPLDGTGLVRRSIAGRTSWSCPLHQR